MSADAKDDNAFRLVQYLRNATIFQGLCDYKLLSDVGFRDSRYDWKGALWCDVLSVESKA